MTASAEHGESATGCGQDRLPGTLEVGIKDGQSQPCI